MQKGQSCRDIIRQPRRPVRHRFSDESHEQVAIGTLQRDQTIVHELSCRIALDAARYRTSHVAKIDLLSGLHRDVLGTHTWRSAKKPFIMLSHIAKLAQINHTNRMATDKAVQIPLVLVRNKSRTLGQHDTTISLLALATSPIRIHRHDNHEKYEEQAQIRSGPLSEYA